MGAKLREGPQTVQWSDFCMDRKRSTGCAENHHLPKISVYLVNACAPDDPFIQIGKQKRDLRQSRYEAEFSRDDRITSR